MKFIKYCIVFCLCFLLGSCPMEVELDIDIGDYENQLEAWNSQNMLDYYQLKVEYWDSSNPWDELITVKDDSATTESLWIVDAEEYTIPEFYSRIKRYEKGMNDALNGGRYILLRLKVSYNTEYHYPDKINITKISNSISIGTSKGGDGSFGWTITLMPMEEGDLDIDIGDYESQLEAWNTQNMLDYQLKIIGIVGNYKGSWGNIVHADVKNGILVSHNPAFIKLPDDMTIPGFYTFIKEKEYEIMNLYNGINRSYLEVQYNTEYHYPIQISYGADHLFGSYWVWEIALTPQE